MRNTRRSSAVLRRGNTIAAIDLVHRPSP
jgi:hypothetical protein